MKRLFAVVLLTVSCAQASDLAQAWKDFSKYRVVSGVKGAVVGIAAIHAALQSWEAGKLTAHKISDASDQRSLFSWDRGNEVIGLSVLTLGMAYTVYKLSWDYLPVYAKHALKM